MIKLNKIEMVRINFLEKRNVFKMMGATSIADKLAVINGYFKTKTLPVNFPKVQNNAR